MPVRGLTAGDFTVVVDGTPRPIVAFDAIDLPADGRAGLDEATWVHTAPYDVVTNKVEDRRLFLILVDDAVMPANPAAVARAKSIAHDVVSRLGADDFAAVVFSMNSQKSQSFTADRARLAAAIDSTSYGFKSASRGPADSSDVSSAWTLANAVSALRSAPQPRKAVAFISAGVSFDASNLAPLMTSVRGANPLSSGEPARLILTELNTLFLEAARSHVSVYAFDVNDLRDGDLMTHQRDYLRTVADNTGGRATIANDDPARGVAQMFRESSAYYLLGFTPGTAQTGRHRVEVRTTHSNARVLARKVFDVARPGTRASAEADPLAPSTPGVLPVDGLPMRATATVLPGPGGGAAIAAIVIGVDQPAERFQDVRAQITVRVDAYDSKGTFRGATKLDAQLKLNPTASARVQCELLAKLELKPGAYQLRIGASAPQLSSRGSVFLDVDVPDFSRASVIVAPLVLSASAATPVAPADAFADLLPVVPTSHRIFRASDRASVLARIVARGQERVLPVALDASVVDSQNRRVFVQSDTITIEGRNRERWYDYRFELPVEALPVGDYLVTVKATTPKGAQEKTLRFSRR